MKVSLAALWKITFTTGSTGSSRTRRRTKIFYFQKSCLIESNDRQSDHSRCSKQRPRRSVWSCMKVAAWQTGKFWSQEPNLPQPCENSSQMIHSEHNSHFSVGLFGAEQPLTTSFWWRLQKNDAVEVALEKKGFLLVLTKTHSKWLKFWLVQLCIEKKVCLFELMVSNNGEGLAVGKQWQVSIQTTSYCLHWTLWIVITTQVSGFIIEIVEVFCECRCSNSSNFVQCSFLVSKLCK